MLRPPQKPPRKAVVRTASVPAPVGGLNLRDAIADMAPQDAAVMDNFFPDRTNVSLRNGYSKWSTGLPGPAESLMAYSSGTGRKLFAAAAAGFYDCTAQGAVGAAVVTGLANARWQYTNVGTPGGYFMLCCNGADTVRSYDGTTWSVAAITGVTTSLLTNVSVWKNRVWFVEKNSMRCWYLPLQSIAGAANVFDFSTIFKLGGYIVAQTNFTFQGSVDVDVYNCICTSEGEVAVYKGTDPSIATAFSLVGIFRVGRPTGPRSFTRVGGDVVAITADGFFEFSDGIFVDRVSTSKAASDKINKGVTADFNAYANTFGWDIKLHPAGSKLIVNVPAGGASRQYVMNTNTTSWCRFTGWNASCFELFGDKLMFGGSDYVAWADNGSDDAGTAIFGDVAPAFGYFGTKTIKRFTMIRPIIQSDGALNLSIGMNYDFQLAAPTSSPALSFTSGSPWNTSAWNISPWQGSLTTKAGWIGVTGNGFAASPRITCSVVGQKVVWQSTDFVYEPGGIY